MARNAYGGRRRDFIKTVGAGSIVGLAGCLGEADDGEREFVDVTMSAWGGPYRDIMFEEFAQPFAEEHNIEIQILEHSNSFDVLSNVRSGQEIHGGFFDDFSSYEAYQEGLLAPIDEDIVTADIDAFFDDVLLDRPGIVGRDEGVRYNDVNTGLFVGSAFYNPDEVDEITNWDDLIANEDLRNDFALLGNVPFYIPYLIGFSMGINLNDLADVSESEREETMDQVWEKMEDVFDRAVDFTNDGNTMNLFSGGSINAGQLPAADARNLSEDTGIPTEAVIPEEGTWANVNPIVIFDETTDADQEYTMQHFIQSTFDRERRAAYAERLPYTQGIDWGDMENPLADNPEQGSLDLINPPDPRFVNEFQTDWSLRQEEL